MRNLRSVFQNVRTAEISVMRSPTDSRKYLIPQTNKVTNAVKVLINRHEAQVLLDPRTEHGNLISKTFVTINNIQVEETEPKTLETVIKESKCSLHYKLIADIDMQGHKEKIPFYACNLKTWDAILGEPAFRSLNAVMYTTENRVTIQPKGKPEQELIMIDKKKESQISTASNYIVPYAESTSDHSGAKTPSMHLQQFLETWEDNVPQPSRSKRKLSPIIEESENSNTPSIKKLKNLMQETKKELEQNNTKLYKDLEEIGNNIQKKIDQF